MGRSSLHKLHMLQSTFMYPTLFSSEKWITGKKQNLIYQPNNGTPNYVPSPMRWCKEGSKWFPNSRSLTLGCQHHPPILINRQGACPRRNSEFRELMGDWQKEVWKLEEIERGRVLRTSWRVWPNHLGCKASRGCPAPSTWLLAGLLSPPWSQRCCGHPQSGRDSYKALLTTLKTPSGNFQTGLASLTCLSPCCKHAWHTSFFQPPRALSSLSTTHKCWVSSNRGEGCRGWHTENKTKQKCHHSGCTEHTMKS